jgi:hypothetical protein
MTPARHSGAGSEAPDLFAVLPPRRRGDKPDVDREVRVLLSVIPLKQAEVPHRAVDGDELVDEPNLGRAPDGSTLWTDTRHTLLCIQGRYCRGGVLI